MDRAPPPAKTPMCFARSMSVRCFRFPSRRLQRSRAAPCPGCCLQRRHAAPRAAAVSETRRVLRRGLVREIVERRDAVGLGPDADRAWARDVAVVQLDVGLAVQENADPGALEL